MKGQRHDQTLYSTAADRRSITGGSCRFACPGRVRAQARNPHCPRRSQVVSEPISADGRVDVRLDTDVGSHRQQQRRDRGRQRDQRRVGCDQRDRHSDQVAKGSRPRKRPRQQWREHQQFRFRTGSVDPEYVFELHRATGLSDDLLVLRPWLQPARHGAGGVPEFCAPGRQHLVGGS